MGKHSHHERRRLYTREGVNVISRTDLREKNRDKENRRTNS
jgi:hypothetical protein